MWSFVMRTNIGDVDSYLWHRKGTNQFCWRPVGKYWRASMVNDEEQHSLWSAFADVPDGWRIVHGEADPTACLDYIERNWTDIRPKSLQKKLAGKPRPER